MLCCTSYHTVIQIPFLIQVLHIEARDDAENIMHSHVAVIFSNAEPCKGFQLNLARILGLGTPYQRYLLRILLIHMYCHYLKENCNLFIKCENSDKRPRHNVLNFNFWIWTPWQCKIGMACWFLVSRCFVCSLAIQLPLNPCSYTDMYFLHHSKCLDTDALVQPTYCSLYFEVWSSNLCCAW